jgi:CheY-like chemotaxis protein
MTYSPDVTLVVDEPPASMRMVTDETMLVRILRNLLSNGLKFTMRGEVRLSVEPGDTDETLKFVVADTGIGIPGDQQERVFEEFHQVRNELQTRAGGTGLGLPYARRLAEILGGSLTLRSEIGRGTEMSLVLPARDARHRTPSILSTVLLVDDDDEFRARLAGLVDDLAHTIIEVPNGREALDSIADRRPDLVFLDLYMPVMNGREVLGVLREKAGLADIPVVVLTSAAPDGLDLSGTGLAAALLLKSQLSAESIRLAMGEAFMAVPRTVNR